MILKLTEFRLGRFTFKAEAIPCNKEEREVGERFPVSLKPKQVLLKIINSRLYSSNPQQRLTDSVAENTKIIDEMNEWRRRKLF